MRAYEFVARYGADGVRNLMHATMDYSERLTRHCLAQLPDGEASFTDWIDDDQIDAGKPIKLVCTVRKHGEMVAKSESHDMYAAIDGAIAKIEKQLHKIEDRFRTKRDAARQKRTSKGEPEPSASANAEEEE